MYLGYMVRTVTLGFLGHQSGTDPDDIKNKKFEFVGEVINYQELNSNSILAVLPS